MVCWTLRICKNFFSLVDLTAPSPFPPAYLSVALFSSLLSYRRLIGNDFNDVACEPVSLGNLMQTKLVKWRTLLAPSCSWISIRSINFLIWNEKIKNSFFRRVDCTFFTKWYRSLQQQSNDHSRSSFRHSQLPSISLSHQHIIIIFIEHFLVSFPLLIIPLALIKLRDTTLPLATVSALSLSEPASVFTCCADYICCWARLG